MDITQVLVEKYPETDWALTDNDYNQLLWEDTNTIPKPTIEELEQKWQEVQQEKPNKILRKQRDMLLKKTDVYGLADFNFKTEESKQAWLEYRQALRDLPSTSQPSLDENGYLINVTWPTPPA